MENVVETEIKELEEIVDKAEVYELEMTGKFTDGTRVSLLRFTGQELLNLKALIKG